MKKLVVGLFVAAFAQTICVAQEVTSKPEVKIEKLAETSQSWDGAMLPKYPTGQPVISIIRYTFPPKMRLAEHYHPIINCGVILNGEITVVTKSGTEKTFRKGDAVIEIVGTDGIHYGENRGDEPTEIIMFYVGETDSALSVKP